MTFSGLHTSVRVAADSLLGRHKPTQQPSELEAPADSLTSDSGLFEDASEGFDRSISLYWNWLRATKAASRLGRGLHQVDGGLILQCEHWLEAADAKHRYGTNLRPYFDYWLSQQQAVQQQQRLQQQQQKQQAAAAAEAEASTPTLHAPKTAAAAAAAGGLAPSPATPGAPLCWSCEGTSHAALMAGQDVPSPSPSTAAATAGVLAAAAAAGSVTSPRRTCSAPAVQGAQGLPKVLVIPEAAAVVMEDVSPHAGLLPAPAAAAVAAAGADTGQRTPRRSCSAPRLTDLERQHLQQLAALGPPPAQQLLLPPSQLAPQQQQQQPPAVAAANRPPAKYGAAGALPAQAEGRFFYWLDEGPGKQVDLAAAGVPRSKLETERVTYLTREEREALEVVVDAGSGLLQFRATQELVDTGTDLGLVVHPGVAVTPDSRRRQQQQQQKAVADADDADEHAAQQAEQEDTDVDEPGMSMTVAAALDMQQRIQDAAQGMAGRGAAAGAMSPTRARPASSSTPARGSCTPGVAPLLQTAASTPEPLVRSGSTDGTPAAATGHAEVSPCGAAGVQQQQQPVGAVAPGASAAHVGAAAGGQQGTPGCPVEPAAASSAVKDTIRKKPCKWIYVLDTQRRLFVHAKYRGKFHHSSFVEGGAVLAAGGIVVQRGKILKLTADSGHYRPSFESFMLTVQQLRDMGADLGETQLSAKHIRCPKLPDL